MFDLENFDAPKDEWKKFLDQQPNKYPDFFKTPSSIQGEQYFKAILELIAKRSLSTESLGGVHNFVRSIANESVQEQILTWFDTYTPIRLQQTRGRGEALVVVRDFRSKCSLIEAKTHPYFSLKPQPRKFWSGKKHIPQPEPVSAPVYRVDAPAITDFDFHKKVVKLAINKFFAERSIENRDELIAAIEAIPLGTSNKKGKPFIQGGAVGSKR